MTGGFATRLKQLARGLADGILPPQCLLCRGRLLDPGSLCAACWMKLSHIAAPCCERLGTPFAYDEGPGSLSAAAIADPPEWQRARAAVGFDPASQGLIHALKYRDRHEAALVMARLMAHAGQRLIAEADVILPVPLHRWRLWRRRYNQSALLARLIAKGAGKPYQPQALRRARATPPQVGLKRDERRRNMRRAFEVPDLGRILISGKRVLLIDDVITTGATANACAATLLAAGAASADVLAFALVLEPRQLHM